VLGTVLLGACGGPVQIDEPSGAPPADAADAATLRRGPDGEPGRPAGVPAEFVATPHGYFHRSCVVALDEDESAEGDVVVRRDGGRRAVARCAHDRFDRHGRRVGTGATPTAPPPTVNGWVASVSSTSAGPVRSISATWKVPRAPSLAGGQTLYFFPGLEPAATGDTILQPVLAWNGFYDRRWTIASWNCCKDGNVLHSAPRNVSVGDAITGTVTGTGCTAVGVCSSWSIRTSSSRGASTTLNTTAYGEVLDWAFGGAVEAYGVDSCRQYPADGRLAFTSISVRTTSGKYTVPAWYAADYGGVPDCLTSVSAAPGGARVDLAWSTR
jgi:hypothetical protein